MKPFYYSKLLPELAARSKYATVSRLGFSNVALRSHLLQVFSTPCGEDGSFLGDPVFEATFGWKTASKKMGDLAGDLLSPQLVDAMDSPPKELRDDYRFPKDATPYEHQLQAWQLLLSPRPQSVVVTSGTGSGKTECFMVPILESLCREALAARQPLNGVRALFLYPLNALINSQRDRLNAWTHAFGDQIRFCLYNGNTPDKVPERDRTHMPNQALDRETLRKEPPPILVTNATMLEYMLVRAQDAPILEKSRGKLQWIVLDEAHSYIGSQAAELALLLRRVLHSFGVLAGQVRFVATSATIGDPAGEAGKKLRSFLADLAGVGVDMVHVVGGQRVIPDLPPGNQASKNLSFDELKAISSAGNNTEQLFSALSGNEIALRLRNRFAKPKDGKSVAQLSEITELQGGKPTDAIAQFRALEWLDLLSGAVRRLPSGRIEPFLPLRAHLFHQVMPGLWACSNPQCRHKADTRLDSSEWPFGRVYLEERKRCDCGSPVFEIQTCNECNETYLAASLVYKEGNYYIEGNDDELVDEFSLDVENDTQESNDDDQAALTSNDRTRVIIANRRMDNGATVKVDVDTLQIEPARAENLLCLDIRQAQETDTGRMALHCPCCHAEDSAKSPLLRRAILGAPFLLGQIIPTLLEFCADGDNPLNKPYRGRRMITFTDSRQGTARIAAKIQQESERNRIRGLVLARVASVVTSESPELQEKRRHLAMMREMVEKAPNPTLSEVIRGMEKDIATASGIKPVQFSEMADHLTTNEPDVKRMYEFYQSIDPGLFGGASGTREFAKMVLAREFARRPRRVNNSETMGLIAVQYPKLSTISSPPPYASITIDDWHAFLKICLDFFVRENTCIDLPDSWMKWGGNKIPRKYLLGPTHKEPAGRGYMKWPQVSSSKTPHRLVRLLAYGLKIAPRKPEGKDLIDTLLRKAWDDLINAQVLQGSLSGGHFVAFESMAFSPISRAWVCPVTRRVLDTTFRGVTPYLPKEGPTATTAECRQILLPTCPLLLRTFPSEAERTQAIREWISSSPEITILREEGIWSDLNDRVMEGGAYFRSAEHSAQQPAARLSTYEKAFKEGYLNLLSCSTTMEMGVDIGGISVVAMNNVPPHPANYLQRAGRAGRRGETRSVALTVCKNNPHDQAVLGNTRWPFDTSLPLPTISLSSSAIVQRHVNSMLLSHFLRHRAGAAGVDLNKLDCGWFLLPRGEALVDQFCDWAENFLEETEPALASGLHFLIRNTCFDGTYRLSTLVHVAAVEMRRVRDQWYGEYAEIVSRIAAFPSAAAQKEPACKALMIQRSRLASEYLLSQLATDGFLPGYGFPTHIASFDTLNLEEINRNKNQAAGHREDNRMRHRDLPSRDLITALREYAPGSDVVMDGLVYRSAGITLNWHAPAAQKEVREIQNIRIAWRCRSCGASGTEPNLDTALHCAECGKPIPPEGIHRYLEPAGFAVDIYAETHNDVTHQQFIKPQLPWIHVQADWGPLPNPRLGRFRTSAEGTAYFHSSGVHELGYAICLKCGRAEPMDDNDTVDTAMSNGHLPTVFRHPHKPLRGKHGGLSAFCTGSEEPWSILTKLHLGHEIRTDVLELQLRNVDGAYLQDETIAFSLAVAIRGAIADTLGVQDEELGCSTKEVRVEGNAICRSILVFDNCPSGYVSSVGDRIDSVIRKAAESLHCPKNCDSSCQHCLSGYSTRFQTESLDRHAALAFLNTDWIRALQLPSDYAYFGIDQSKAEFQPLPEAIWRELVRPTTSEIRVFLQQTPDNWDLAISPLRSYLYRWIGKEKPITLVLRESTLQNMSSENRQMLGVWASLDLVAVTTCTDLPSLRGGSLLAQSVGTTEALSWVAHSDDLNSGCPGIGWGAGTERPIVVGRTASAVPVPLRRIDPSSLMTVQSSADTYSFEISSELNGKVQRFGERFWELIFAGHPEIRQPFERAGNQVIGVAYRDRYLHAPLPVGLILEVITGLKRRFEDLWQPPQIQLETVQLSTPLQMQSAARFIWTDWTDEQVRKEAILEAFRYCGLDEIDLVLCSKQQAEHARTLEIRFKDGSIILMRFDQGLSYWKAERTGGSYGRIRNYENEFDFSSPAPDQGEKIAEMRAEITNPNYSTFLYANLR